MKQGRNLKVTLKRGLNLHRLPLFTDSWEFILIFTTHFKDNSKLCRCIKIQGKLLVMSTNEFEASSDGEF